MPHLHFSRDEFAARQRRVLVRMAEQGLDGLLMFRQESMYYLTGYDTDGFVLFQAAARIRNGMASARITKWGYIVGLIVAGLRLAVQLVGQTMTSALNDPIGLMFAVALVALLLHPQSRQYQKIWFS